MKTAQGHLAVEWAKFAAMKAEFETYWQNWMLDKELKLGGNVVKFRRHTNICHRIISTGRFWR